MDTYLVDEQMLGDDATVAHARRMVQLLQERGHNVAYGHAVGQDEAVIPADVWYECLDIISKERCGKRR